VVSEKTVLSRNLPAAELSVPWNRMVQISLPGRIQTWIYSNRRDLLIQVLMMTVCAAIFTASINNFMVGTYQDDGHYLITARSIAEGRGYRLVSYPDAPPETHFPPGYSLILAGPYALSNGSFDHLKALSLFATLAAVPVWRSILGTLLAPTHAWLATIVAFTTPSIVVHAGLIMSEAIFLLMLGLAWILARHIGESGRWRLRLTLLLALLLGLIPLVRLAGIAFVVAILGYLVARRAGSALLIASIGGALPLLLWIGRNISLGAGLVSVHYEHEWLEGSFGAHGITSLTDLIARPATNALTIITAVLPQAFSLSIGQGTAAKLAGAWLGSFLLPSIGLVIALTILVGALVSLRAKNRHLTLGLVLYVGIVLLWTVPLLRYLHPILPLLCALMAIGITTLIRLIWRGHSSFADCLLPAVFLIFLAANAVENFQQLRDPVRNRITDITAGASFIRETVPEGEIVMSTFPIERSLYLQRYVIDVPREESPDGLRQAILAGPASAVVVAPPIQTPRPTGLDESGDLLLAALANASSDFALAYHDSSQSVSVFTVNRAR
jgi:hypothetical protein